MIDGSLVGAARNCRLAPISEMKPSNNRASDETIVDAESFHRSRSPLVVPILTLTLIITSQHPTAYLTTSGFNNSYPFR